MEIERELLCFLSDGEEETSAMMGCRGLFIEAGMMHKGVKGVVGAIGGLTSTGRLSRVTTGAVLTVVVRVAMRVLGFW